MERLLGGHLCSEPGALGLLALGPSHRASKQAWHCASSRRHALSARTCRACPPSPAARMQWTRAVSSYKMMQRNLLPRNAQRNGYAWNQFCADPAGFVGHCLADARCKK